MCIYIVALFFFIAKEPKDNGPLFVEMHFYLRNGKLEDSTFSLLIVNLYCIPQLWLNYINNW